MAADEDRTDGTERDTDPAGAGATTEPDERDWTNGSPPVDGHAEPAIRAAAKACAPYYTGPAWDPDAGGPGATILQLFAHLAAGVIERLDQVPGKHRHAFVDELGFDRLPPQQVTEQTPDADEVRHEAAGIRLGVIEPPGPQRIDGIGDITAEELARGGIETVSELASANPEAVRVLTGASGETARDWRERADRYSANDVLTHVQQIGLLEAEAFAEVSLFSDHRDGSLSSLSDVAYDELVQEVTALEEETAFKSKYATAIRELTWDVVEESLERIRQG